MKKYLLGGVIAILLNYCIGATYIIYKGVDKNVRANRSNANPTN